MPMAMVFILGDTEIPFVLAQGETLQIREHEGLLRISALRTDGTDVPLLEHPVDPYGPEPVRSLVSLVGRRDVPDGGVVATYGAVHRLGPIRRTP